MMEHDKKKSAAAVNFLPKLHLITEGSSPHHYVSMPVIPFKTVILTWENFLLPKKRKHTNRSAMLYCRPRKAAENLLQPGHLSPLPWAAKASTVQQVGSGITTVDAAHAELGLLFHCALPASGEQAVTFIFSIPCRFFSVNTIVRRDSYGDKAGRHRPV